MNKHAKITIANIIQNIDELSFIIGTEIKLQKIAGKSTDKFDDCTNQIDTVRRNVHKLKDQLEVAYKKDKNL